MSTEAAEFRVDLHDRAKADVYFACDGWNETAAKLIRHLDCGHVRVVGSPTDLPPSRESVRRIMGACSGLVYVHPLTQESTSYHLSLAAELGIPVLAGNHGSVDRIADSEDVEMFLGEVLRFPRKLREYAFYIGRLERDFAHAREAIRTAVENEAGIPFLWVDDGRHKTNVDGLRESTRLVVQHASFVVADLTLGVESPDRENPSRAHEIGMSMAYGRRLLLLSQEPRRYTYFSINDLQTIFWSNEHDLECRVREWVHNFRDSLGRTTWNYRLTEMGYEPKIARLDFQYNPDQRYIGPRTPGAARLRRAPAAMAFGAAALLVLTAVTLTLVLMKLPL